MPWPSVALGILAACLLALFGPFGQIQCKTTYRPATNWAIQLPEPAPLGGHVPKAQLCTNVSSRGAFHGARWD